MSGLRLMLYDRTCAGPRGLPGLTASWRAGGHLYTALGRLDAWQGFSRWDDALRWLAEVGGDRPIREIQYWGHGRWGRVLLAGASLDRRALAPDHPLAAHLSAVRDRMGPESLWWFRTCETFGARAGQDFARAWVDGFGCAAAGHTYVIGPWQSGLCLLRPGEVPAWDPWEGLADGTPDAPRRARMSSPFAPRTISCLRGDVPAWALTGARPAPG